MEKELAEELPPAYTNLGYDDDLTAGPSAPKSDGFENELPLDPLPTFDEPAGPSLAPPPLPGFVTYPLSEPLQCNLPCLQFHDIYEACIHYVDKHCCYSTRFANKMKLTNIENKCAFHYTLESFGEKRETGWKYTPYKGGPIDGPSNGRAPGPWDMAALPPQLFTESKSQYFVPHTESVETCSKCSGSGKVTCSSCNGRGRVSCSSCSGSGRKDGDRCSWCSGSGRKRCLSCSGSGRVTCSRCDGYGKVKNYLVLFVTWTNHKTDWVSEIGKVPAKKLKAVTGDTLLTETDRVLLAISNAPDATVNVASERMLTAHHNSFPNELFIKQRHSLRAVPFTIARFQWKETEGEFYIFGKEKEVYFEDYPTNCCCICC